MAGATAQSPAKKTKRRKDFDIFEMISLVSNSTVRTIVDAPPHPRKPHHRRRLGVAASRDRLEQPAIESQRATNGCYRGTRPVMEVPVIIMSTGILT